MRSDTLTHLGGTNINRNIIFPQSLVAQNLNSHNILHTIWKDLEKYQAHPSEKIIHHNKVSLLLTWKIVIIGMQNNIPTCYLIFNQNLQTLRMSRLRTILIIIRFQKIYSAGHKQLKNERESISSSTKLENLHHEHQEFTYASIPVSTEKM